MLQQQTKEFLTYLQDHPEIRKQIRAPHNQTLLYAGRFFKPLWVEINEIKKKNPEFAQKVILPEVLSRIKLQDKPFPNLKKYVETVDHSVPWKPDGFTIWRALSGIFASNATGSVSFQIGSGIELSEKVFAATEVGVLLRNPNIDATTKDLVAFYQRCILQRQVNINFGFISS